MTNYEREKRILADYFAEYMRLYHQLQLSEDDEEIAQIERDVNRIREEVKRRYPFYDKNGASENL